MENPSFSVNDLLFVKNLIETINRRGGFQPGEMSSVGQFYNRISAFIDYSVNQMQEMQNQPPEQPQSSISPEDEATARSIIGV